MIYYKAMHILISEHEDALEIYQQLMDGADFEELASEFSECPSQSKGGHLGSFPSGKMHAEFEKALSKLKFNEISTPIKTKFGFHIIKRLER